jgi:DNA-binding response OmpR family regulator
MAQVLAAHVDTTPTKPIPSIDASPVEPRRGAILVVEDRNDVRQGLTQLLELHGFLVADAADGGGALEQLEADPEGIALVLLDLMLPGPLSGRDVRARQLADGTIAAIPTIVVSACEPDVSARTQLKPDAWLEKPFRFDELLALVKRYVVPESAGVMGIEQ